MTDRPILFSGPMVRAILDGRKTQTRRVLHVQPPAWATFCQQPSMLNVLHRWVPSALWRWSEEEQDPPRPLRSWPVDKDGQHYWLHPRFAAGDRLWVREAHAIFDAHGQHRDDGLRWGPWGGLPTELSVDRTQIAYFREGFGRSRPRWRPGIHMPRWASRLTLAVTEVRVERLQDISEADAIAEGVEDAGGGVAFVQRSDALTYSTPTGCYAALWNDLNAKRGYGWDANPWVVALTFTVHHRNIDAPGAKEAA